MHAWTMVTFNPTKRRSTLALSSPLNSNQEHKSMLLTSPSCCSSSNVQRRFGIRYRLHATTSSHNNNRKPSRTLQRNSRRTCIILHSIAHDGHPRTAYPLHSLLHPLPLPRHLHISFRQTRRTIHRAGQIILLFYNMNCFHLSSTHEIKYSLLLIS